LLSSGRLNIEVFAAMFSHDSEELIRKSLSVTSAKKDCVTITLNNHIFAKQLQGHTCIANSSFFSFFLQLVLGGVVKTTPKPKSTSSTDGRKLTLKN